MRDVSKEERLVERKLRASIHEPVMRFSFTSVEHREDALACDRGKGRAGYH